MATQTTQPKTVKTVNAREAAKSIALKIGLPVTPKAVRTVARDLLPAYQDDKYTQHKYDASTLRQLTAAFVARTARRQASVEADKSDD